MKQPKPSNPALENETTESGAAATVRVATVAEREWFDQQLTERHYLGAGRSVGDYLRQIVTVRGQVAALLVWGPACYALKDRDRWIGWSANQRVERLKLIVQNRRFLVLGEKGRSPNLASQAMGAALRALPAQWQEHFGYRPLLAESFTDPEAYAGTCYKASNWEPVGFSAGYARHRADFYVPNERPKRLWLRALDAQARRHLRAVTVPADCVGGLLAPPSGVLPLTRPQMLALEEVFRQAPDPRAKNTRFRIGPVLTLIAMALLAGRRDIAEIARFASTLTPTQRHQLGLPRKRGTQAFYHGPRLRGVLSGAHPARSGGLCRAARRLAANPRRHAAAGPRLGRQDDPRPHRTAHPRAARGRRAAGRGNLRSEGRHCPLRAIGRDGAFEQPTGVG